MTTTPRRRLGRMIRKARRRGYTKQDVLAYRNDFASAWIRIAELAAPAIQHLLAIIAADDERRQPLVHDGRKPR
ncbi:MAG: hypothetical protein ACTH6N_13760 [Brachybacterium tyrofermentans]|uniref:hypothetical protein n=1 Tax=Brachybacterium tyrofermentans TaxID=47848 RepID=UPI001868C619|nr:hypothetical protein [Brachybacterium tyrofermentans]